MARLKTLKTSVSPGKKQGINRIRIQGAVGAASAMMLFVVLISGLASKNRRHEDTNITSITSIPSPAGGRVNIYEIPQADMSAAAGIFIEPFALNISLDTEINDTAIPMAFSKYNRQAKSRAEPRNKP
jgi:hypothetical protein